MKKLRFVVLITFVLSLAFPCAVTAEFTDDSGIEEYNQLIDSYIADGMTLEEIATATYLNDTSGLSAYSDNYLKLLLLVVEYELQQRNFKSGEVVVPMGEYIVGEDIPAGTYTVAAGKRYCSLEIYTNGKLVHDFDMSAGGIVGKVTLKQGQIVCVEYDSMTFSPYKGLGF